MNTAGTSVRARQARLRVRSAVGLAVILGGLAAVTAWQAPDNVMWKVIAGTSCAVTIGAICDVVAARYQATPPSRRAGESAVTSQFVRSTDGLWDQRHVRVGSRVVTFRASARRGPVDQVRQLVDRVARDAGALQGAFERFREQEALKRPHYADMIRQLELDTIDFVSVESPLAGEVSFSAESHGELWTCMLENGDFKELTLDN